MKWRLELPGNQKSNYGTRMLIPLPAESQVLEANEILIAFCVRDGIHYGV